VYHSLKGIYSGLYSVGSTPMVLLDVHDVEWQLETSKTTLSQLPAIGQPFKLYTYFQHSEDQEYLCGFSTQEERRVFLELLKVQGIGPRAALKILSGTTPERLVAMLATGDLAGLEKIPGLGKKTSAKLLLTLQGKLVLNQAEDEKFQLSGPDAEIIQALTEMGFDRKAATEAVAKISPDVKNLSADKREPELLRRSIIALS